MDSRDASILRHIMNYCKDIRDSIERFGNDIEVFKSDTDYYYYSVSMAMLQIGELSAKLTEGFRMETKDQMPWEIIRGMRNRFVHGYGEMDIETIWNTAATSIPEMFSFCENKLKP